MCINRQQLNNDKTMRIMILPPQMQWAKTTTNISKYHRNLYICGAERMEKSGQYMWMCESHYYGVYHLMADFMQRLCSFSPTVSNPAAPKSLVLRFHSHRLTDFMILWLDWMKYMPSGKCRLNGINGNALCIQWPDLSYWRV